MHAGAGVGEERAPASEKVLFTEALSTAAAGFVQHSQAAMEIRHGLSADWRGWLCWLCVSEKR